MSLIPPVQNKRWYSHCRGQFQGFLPVGKGAVSTLEIIAPDNAEAYPCKQDEASQNDMRSEDDQEIDSCILNNCPDQCRNLADPAA